jgi:predicted DNA-binding transcriptional regulator AlpA
MNDVNAAAYVGISRTKFRELVGEGLLPKPINIGGCVRWDRLELDAAFDEFRGRRQDTDHRRKLNELIDQWDKKDQGR